MHTLMIAPCAGLERCLAAAKSVQDQQQLLNASRRSPGRSSQVSQEPPECEDEGGEKLFLVAPGSGVMSEIAPKPHPARQTALSGSLVIGGSMTESNVEMSAELTRCAVWLSSIRPTQQKTLGLRSAKAIETQEHEPDMLSATLLALRDGLSALSGTSAGTELAGPGFQFARGSDGRLSIGAIAPGGAADTDGSLAVGDEILAVDGREVHAHTRPEDVRAAIIGECGSTVRLTIFRRVERRTIEVPTLAAASALSPVANTVTITSARAHHPIMPPSD